MWWEMAGKARVAHGWSHPRLVRDHASDFVEGRKNYLVAIAGNPAKFPGIRDSYDASFESYQPFTLKRTKGYCDRGPIGSDHLRDVFLSDLKSIRSRMPVSAKKPAGQPLIHRMEEAARR
ncbi:MAG: hypothetical protein ABI383_06070 [Acidobacteriaceae bacterium]